MTETGEASELVDELIMESIREDETEKKAPRWHRKVAFTSLVLALLTAVGGLLGGITAHEALITRTEEVMEISRRETNRIHIEVLDTKHTILRSLGESIDAAELGQIEAFEDEAIELGRELFRQEVGVQMAGFTHIAMAVAVTIMSVGITLSGMAVVVDEKILWFASIAVGVIGAIGLAIGIALMLA